MSAVAAWVWIWQSHSFVLSNCWSGNRFGLAYDICQCPWQNHAFSRVKCSLLLQVRCAPEEEEALVVVAARDGQIHLRCRRFGNLDAKLISIWYTGTLSFNCKWIFCCHSQSNLGKKSAAVFSFPGISAKIKLTWSAVRKKFRVSEVSALPRKTETTPNYRSWLFAVCLLPKICVQSRQKQITWPTIP